MFVYNSEKTITFKFRSPIVPRKSDVCRTTEPYCYFFTESQWRNFDDVIDFDSLDSIIALDLRCRDVISIETCMSDYGHSSIYKRLEELMKNFTTCCKVLEITHRGSLHTWKGLCAIDFDVKIEVHGVMFDSCVGSRRKVGVIVHIDSNHIYLIDDKSLIYTLNRDYSRQFCVGDPLCFSVEKDKTHSEIVVCDYWLPPTTFEVTPRSRTEFSHEELIALQRHSLRTEFGEEYLLIQKSISQSYDKVIEYLNSINPLDIFQSYNVSYEECKVLGGFSDCPGVLMEKRTIETSDNYIKSLFYLCDNHRGSDYDGPHRAWRDFDEENNSIKKAVLHYSRDQHVKFLLIEKQKKMLESAMVEVEFNKLWPFHAIDLKFLGANNDEKRSMIKSHNDYILDNSGIAVNCEHSKYRA